MTTNTETETAITVQGVTEITSTDNETYLYGTVAVTLNGHPMDVGAVIGARESDRDTARRVGLRGFLTAYWEDQSDWAGVARLAKSLNLDPDETRIAVRSALMEAAPRLWRESEDLRAEWMAANWTDPTAY